ncbi:MAG: hypothetical protein MJK14_19915 [Rivularia sp. ALOHA_DT_140]|nr:hypothetical protein [Rivularia sp. ALOHA_DT_140]
MKFKSIALTLFTVSIASVFGTTAAQAASLSVLADGLALFYHSRQRKNGNPNNLAD